MFWKNQVKDIHEVAVFHCFSLIQYLQDKFDLFWKIIDFWDACSGIFTKILNPVLEFSLKMVTLHVSRNEFNSKAKIDFFWSDI